MVVLLVQGASERVLLRATVDGAGEEVGMSDVIETPMDEAAMREAKVPWPKSEEELVSYLRTLFDRTHDYGTCVYAMSMAATAAFYYGAHRVGSSGAQAGFAELDFLRRTRGMEHGFQIVDYADFLYPQYLTDPVTLAAYKEAFKDPERRERMRSAAKKLLLDRSHAAPRVADHWRMLAHGPTPGGSEVGRSAPVRS